MSTNELLRTRLVLSEPTGDGAHPGTPSRIQLFGLLLGYFALQLMIRVSLSNSADLDEAEQCILTQKMLWGYGPQPPLYMWIQKVFFTLLGTNILALSLFKNILLACTYFFTYSNARLITRSHLCATAAALSLTLIPQVVWESQRDLTNSVLSATLATATLFCFLHMHESKKTRWFMGFGLCAGLGLLSKYNYAFGLLGLILAAASLKELRPTLRDKRFWLALLLGLAVFAPNAVWILRHSNLAFMTASKFALQESYSWGRTVWIGSTKLLVAIVSFVGPLLATYLLIFHQQKTEKPLRFGQPFLLQERSIFEKLLARSLWFIAGLLMILVVGFHSTDLRERWLQPILISAPVLAIALVQERVDAKRTRQLFRLAIVILLIVLAVMPGRILLAERLRRTETLTRPFRRLAEKIAPDLAASTFVVTDTRVLAGNLHLAFPGPTVVTPELTELFGPAPRSCILVWEVGRESRPSKPLLHWAEDYAGKEIDWSRARVVSSVFLYHHDREQRLGVLMIQKP